MDANFYSQIIDRIMFLILWDNPKFQEPLDGLLEASPGLSMLVLQVVFLP